MASGVADAFLILAMLFLSFLPAAQVQSAFQTQAGQGQAADGSPVLLEVLGDEIRASIDGELIDLAEARPTGSDSRRVARVRIGGGVLTATAMAQLSQAYADLGLAGWSFEFEESGERQ